MSSVVLVASILLANDASPHQTTQPPPTANCWPAVPPDVRSRVPIVAACTDHLAADFDADGYLDHALLLTAEAKGEVQRYLAVASKGEMWLLRRWAGSKPPDTLRLAKPDRYVRPGGLLEPLEGDEVTSFTSRHPGVRVGTWAFFLDRGGWLCVRLSR